MQGNNKSYRIKYDQENPIDHINIKIDQDFDLFEVLTMKISQEDAYKLYTSNYGVVVGRVLANDGFGIPNAKISIFLPNNSNDETLDSTILYPYKTTSDKNIDGIRYNLLPSKKINKCHQNVGSLPSKRDILDNNSTLDVYDNFYKYTTTTNESGDYMLFGISTGVQNIHIDIDLSDIGVLSQTPRDMTYKGHNLKQFDNPNKFKKNKNLDSLSQIISQDTSIYVYPFWGDETEGEISISKKTINIPYKFEPTCVFMGSIFTDSVKSGIGKTCKPNKTSGKMSEMTSSEGKINMIRYTVDNKIERYDIDGGSLINGDGVWCYQIPMNLDYVVTDEYGNLVPTTDPGKGIPTRTKVRFKVNIDNNGDEFVQTKTGTYLIPNNPENISEEDYEFSENCKETSFVDLMWNKVYSVKNYIPRIQKGTSATDRHFNGLKSINYHENNNPTPYNNIWININLRFMLMCLLTRLFVKSVSWLNTLISNVGNSVAGIVFQKLQYVVLDTSMFGECSIFDTYNYFIPHNINKANGVTDYFNVAITNTNAAHVGASIYYERSTSLLEATNTGLGCIETQLSQENEVTNFDFFNDWINGSLYAPSFLSKVKKNRVTGEKTSKFCGSYLYNNYANLYLVQTCAPSITKTGTIESGNETCTDTIGILNTLPKCYKKNSHTNLNKGIINKNIGEDTYYYRSIEFSDKNKYINTTDIILLGSLNDCDPDGIPQLHQLLPSTSFKLPPDSFEPDEIPGVNITEDYSPTGKTMSGIDWGNNPLHPENGLFVAIDCMDSATIIKTCVNASRLCEIGVDFDEKHEIEIGSNIINKYIDGYISTDEISDGDARGMFATLNNNKLKTKLNKYSQVKYDFAYNYPDGFDGKLKTYLADDILNNDYYNYKFGLKNNTNGLYYTTNYSFPRFDNSFYFYFGLKDGFTALDIFNKQYFTPCSDIEKEKFEVTLTVLNNEGLCS